MAKMAFFKFGSYLSYTPDANFNIGNGDYKIQFDILSAPNQYFGEVTVSPEGLDAAGVRAAVGLESANLDTQLEAILEDTGTTIPALISAGSGAGVGAISYPYTLTDADDENPISGAEVWVTTDSSGSNIVASGYTNLFGTVIFFLMQEHIIFGVNVQAIILQIRT